MNHLVGVVHDVAGRGEPGPQGGDVHVDRQPAVDGAVEYFMNIQNEQDSQTQMSSF